MPLLERTDQDLISTSFSTPLSRPRPKTLDTGRSGPDDENEAHRHGGCRFIVPAIGESEMMHDFEELPGADDGN